MHRPGTDPDNVQMEDVLCDFCLSPWNEETPFIEGHHGSILCGSCLTAAYTHVVLNESSSAPSGSSCTMCLEQRDDPSWRSPQRETAVVCRRCVKLAAGALHKDKDYNWTRPQRPA